MADRPSPDDLLASIDPAILSETVADRPYLVTNFVSTLDGRATLGGVSGPIGSSVDTEMLLALRCVPDAVMIGAGTMRTERYGRVVPSARRRALRVKRGLAADPLAVIVSSRLELPWDAGLFSCGAGEVVIVTTSRRSLPELATPTSALRFPERVDLAAALAWLRAERGVRLVLCEGGPHLHGELLSLGAVDEVFLTVAAKLGGEQAPRIVEGMSETKALDPIWIERIGAELFTRWRVVTG